jgi:transglycosylase-like protein with SLT domain
VALSPAAADIAHLRNGQTLDVSGFKMDGERIVLLLQGGGEMAVPATHVLAIERKEPAAPSESLPEPSGASGERLTIPSRPVADPDLAPPAPGTAEPPVVLPAGSVPDRATVREIGARIAHKYDVDERLVLAVIEVESRYDTFAISRRGAIGLMQLMPETAVRFAVKNPYNPVENIDGGVRYLKELLERYSGQKRLALAAYNAGEEAVERFSGIPPYRETVLYVDRVLRAFRR